LAQKIAVPKHKRANIDKDLLEKIEELEALGDIITHAVLHYKSFTDASFPKGEPEKEHLLSVCLALNEVLVKYGINAEEVCGCPATYEES
jgi:hypothetical protein